MKKREDFSKEGQKSNPFTVRFKKTFLEDIKKRRGLVKGQQIADFLVDMYNQAFNPIVGNPVFERNALPDIDPNKVPAFKDVKVSTSEQKPEKNRQLSDKFTHTKKDRPEPPAGLSGIDLTIWKRENWK